MNVLFTREAGVRNPEPISETSKCSITDYESEAFGDWLASKARRIFRLMSSDIEALCDKENHKKGIIVVGGMRTVGNWEVVTE